MPASHRDSIDGLSPQFIGQLAQLLARQISQIGGYLYPVQQRCARRHYFVTPQPNADFSRIPV